MEKQNPIKFKVVKEDGYYAYHLPIITQLGILEDALQECNIDIDLVFEFENKIGLCGGGIFYDDFYLYSLMLRYLFPNNKTMMISDSLLTCPNCGNKQPEEMPENTCQYSYRCSSCDEVIKTPKGECCVYCVYGDYPCLQAQLVGSACCSPD